MLFQRLKTSENTSFKIMSIFAIIFRQKIFTCHHNTIKKLPFQILLQLFNKKIPLEVRRLFCALKRTEEKGKFGKWNGCRNISGMRNQWRQFRFILRMASEIFGHGQKLPHFIENVCHVHSALLHCTSCNLSRRSSVNKVTTIVGISAIIFQA